MNKIFPIVFALAVTGGAVSQADEILINDDFSASGVTTNTRFTNSHIGASASAGDWVVRSTDGPAWSVASGALVNPSTVANDEKGAHRAVKVSSGDTSLTQITVSFDYTVGSGTTLYFSSSLFTGAPTGLSARMTQTNGAWYAGDFNDGGGGTYGSGFAGPDYNLKDGSTPLGNVGAALTSFGGGTSGTFSQTYDISAFGGGFSIADVSHVLAVFTSDGQGGAISIDNFNMTATSGGLSGFSTWITGVFANGTVTNQGPNDDDDNDGISNLVEYAIDGQDPTVPNASVGTFSGNVLSFTKRGDATGLTYAIEESTGLVGWAEVSGGSYVNDAATISYTLTPGSPEKNFVRLKVTQN